MFKKIHQKNIETNFLHQDVKLFLNNVFQEISRHVNESFEQIMFMWF